MLQGKESDMFDLSPKFGVDKDGIFLAGLNGTIYIKEKAMSAFKKELTEAIAQYKREKKERGQ